MSSTPLFDQIARNTDARPSTVQQAPVPAVPVTGRPLVSPSQSVAPSSPLSAPVASSAVPAGLVNEINEIPTWVSAAARSGAVLSPEQLALVEVLGDSFIRVVVDALAAELDRIARDRAVNG